MGFDWAESVFAQIEAGAADVAAAVAHWRSTIYPPDPKKCSVDKIQLEGSDLHDKGLGALFVTYSKPAAANGMFPNQGTVKVVLKPEDRSLEKALVGKQDDSLANQISEMVGLDEDSSIATIGRATDAEHGSLIEFIKGTLAKDFQGKPDQAYQQAFSEGIAFVILAGLSDEAVAILTKKFAASKD